MFVALIAKIVLILIAVAYFTIAERKVMAAIQRRRGPNVVGIYGLLQPLADGLKLFVKKLIIPTSSSKIIFLIAPLIILTLSLVNWSVLPFFVQDDAVLTSLNEFLSRGLNYVECYLMQKPSQTEVQKNLNTATTGIVAIIPYNIMFLLALSSLNVYAIIIAGWASNSKYAFLGSLRSAAQMISYEVSIGLVLLPVVLLAKKADLTQVVIAQNSTGWFLFPLLPCFIIFFISMLAETNRTPFDLPEAEAELVAGYNVEYSSIIFAMFFLGEYSNMLLMSSLISIFFCGGWLAPIFFSDTLLWLSLLFFSVKIGFFCFLFILIRATLPRYKYAQLMSIGWKIFLPITLAFLMLATSIFVCI